MFTFSLPGLPRVGHAQKRRLGWGGFGRITRIMRRKLGGDWQFWRVLAGFGDVIGLDFGRIRR